MCHEVVGGTENNKHLFVPTGGGDLEFASLPLGLVVRRDREKVSLGAASMVAKDVGTYMCVPSFHHQFHMSTHNV